MVTLGPVKGTSLTNHITTNELKNGLRIWRLPTSSKPVVRLITTKVKVVCRFLGGRVVVIPRVKKAYKIVGGQILEGEGWRVDDGEEEKNVIIFGEWYFATILSLLNLR